MQLYLAPGKDMSMTSVPTSVEQCQSARWPRSKDVLERNFVSVDNGTLVQLAKLVNWQHQESMDGNHHQGRVKSTDRSSLEEDSHGGSGPKSTEEHADGSDELGIKPHFEDGNAESEPASNPLSELPPDIAALAHHITYRPDEWRGITPLQFLEQFCAKNKLPSACYNVADSRHIATMYTACCILSHLGVQVVPVRVYPTAEEARQNAALCAILFLEGAITYSERPYVLLRQSASPHFHLGGIGIVPSKSQAVQMLDSKDDHLSKQQELLERDYQAKKAALIERREHIAEQKRLLALGGDGAEAVIHDIAASEVLEKKRPPLLAAKRVKTLRVNAEKNPVQALKELCDKQKWQQPFYEFLKPPVGDGHICRLSLQDLRDPEFLGMQSDQAPNQKTAKGRIAARALAMLNERGYQLNPVKPPTTPTPFSIPPP